MKVSASTPSTMFSYLQARRPNNRRSALPPVTAPQRIVPSKYYHEAPPYAADASAEPVPYSVHSEESPSSPSPVSLDPPKLPPIPRVASQHEPHQLVKEHGLPESEPPSMEGYRSDTERPLITLSGSAPGDISATRMATRDEPVGASSPQMMAPAIVLTSQDQFANQWLRPPHSPYDRINSNFESSQSYPRPKSAGNLTPVPQPRRPPPPPPVPPPVKPLQPAVGGASQARLAKTKLNLLNPMSLLTRRRSSQAVTEATSDKYLQAKSPNIPGMNLPDDYDPRIRGNVIHDFSAPRPGRSVSSNALNISTGDWKNNRDSRGINQQRMSPNPNSAPVPEEDSPNSLEREHTPIFKEHFDDDVGLEQSRHEEMSKQGAPAFMYQLSLKESYLDSDSSSLPPFARNLPTRLSKAVEGNYPASSHSSQPPLEVVLETGLADDPSAESSVKSSPPISPPKARSRASSSTDSPFQSAGFPKRLKSNASRFSFDLAGVGSSAQEKLLEEKHRQKAKRESRESRVSGGSDISDVRNDADDDGEYSDYDDLDDDGLEERIPGVNADANDPLMPRSLQITPNSHYLSPIESSLTSPKGLASTGLTSPDPSNESTDQPFASVVPQPSPHQKPTNTSQYSTISNDINFKPLLCHPSGDHVDLRSSGRFINPKECSNTQLAGLPSRHNVEDDDLYFDDGIIEDLENRDEQAFDESVFDDDTSRIYGLPLRDLKPRPETIKTDKAQNQGNRHENDCLPAQGIEGSEAEVGSARIQSRVSFVEHNREAHPTFSHAAGLTEDNLAAYHDALAFATNQAALNGEFNRRQSLIPPSQDGNLNETDSAPGMTPDDGRASQEINGLCYVQDIDDPEDFNFDDDLSDDPIIAAANAEALENDDDGFYGQEFGFFARGTGSAEYANGGYFGPRGVEGIGRSYSGRANFQEPSLTPITERSEWSNRNSAISLAMHAYAQPMQPTLSNPGLAQLADMMSREEDNMSLSALMKLRRGAWGGSSTSLQSSSGSQISGSLNFFSNNPGSSAPAAPNPAGSTFSLASSNGLTSSDSDASPSSPTITIATHTLPPAAAAPSRSEGSPVRPPSSHLKSPAKGHSRNSSGPESVSYLHEKDEEGGRWVVEKRRLMEGGKVEVLGREVLQEGMI